MRQKSDEYDLHNMNYPNVPGQEGAGLVVASGGGFKGWRYIGKRVCFTRCATNDGKLLDGSFSQYCVVDSTHIHQLPALVDYQQGSMSIINPLTAIGI